MTNRRRAAPAGDYDHRIAIQQRLPGTNAADEPNGEWQNIAIVWAKVTPLRGTAYFEAAQLQFVVDARITFRYGVAIEPGMRALSLRDGTPYEIQPGIDPNSARSELELLCKTGVRDGR